MCSLILIKLSNNPSKYGLGIESISLILGLGNVICALKSDSLTEHPNTFLKSGFSFKFSSNISLNVISPSP